MELQSRSRAVRWLKRTVPVAAGVFVLSMSACSDQTREEVSAPQFNNGQGNAPLLAQAKGRIADSYIVVLKEGAAGAGVAGVSAKAAAYGITPMHVYGTALRGFAAEIKDRGQLMKLIQDPDVLYITENGLASTMQTGPAPEPRPEAPPRDPGAQVWQCNLPSGLWGLDRLNNPFGVGLDGCYDYVNTGTPARVYILDTGIRTTHDQFLTNGTTPRRAFAGTAGFDAYPADGMKGQDCHGHGTHVAGTVAGWDYGVAKRAKVYSIRVLGGAENNGGNKCGGSGTWAGVIAGLDWVAANHTKPAVANMSLGGGYNQAVNDAVTRLITYGVTVVVAAGNDNQNASGYSPASTPLAITVAATDVNNAKAWFSNFGALVDIHAAGVGVLSAHSASNTATATWNGTSMASPHVAGLAALVLQNRTTMGPGQVWDIIRDMSVKGVVTSNVSGTPNRLYHRMGSFFISPGTSQYPVDTRDACATCEYYTSGSPGFHAGWLRGNAGGSNVDLYLERWNGTTWVQVAKKAGTSVNEYLAYNSPVAGLFRWRVHNSGTTNTMYDFFMQRAP
jgi:aqualysin 1